MCGTEGLRCLSISRTCVNTVGQNAGCPLCLTSVPSCKSMQSHEVRAEIKEIMAVPQNIVSPQVGRRAGARYAG